MKCDRCGKSESEYDEFKNWVTLEFPKKDRTITMLYLYCSDCLPHIIGLLETTKSEMKE